MIETQGARNVLRPLGCDMSSFFMTFWNFLKTSEGASLTTAISTIVLTLTTMVYAWLTAVLAKENKLLRKAGTEPQIIAYLSPIHE